MKSSVLASCCALLLVLGGLLWLSRPRPGLAPDDHLEPEVSILGGHIASNPQYDLALRERFEELYDSDGVRMVVQPSFIPEYAVGLLHKGGGTRYRILVLTSPVQLWGKQARNHLPDAAPARRCEKSVSDELGGRIFAVWEKMLRATRPSPTYTGGADGSIFHFGMDVPKSEPLSGKIWTPAPDTATGRLTAIGETMRAVCEKNAPESQLETVTAELERLLHK